MAVVRRRRSTNEGYSIRDVIEQRFREQTEHLNEIKKTGIETKEKVEFQNGRVRKLEDWSNEARTVIEASSKTLLRYRMDKARLWVAITLLVFLGGTIITLSVMAIDSKIKVGIREALSGYNIEIHN